MIFIWLSPLFIALNIYYIVEITKWLTAIDASVVNKRFSKFFHIIIKALKIIYAILWSLASVSIYISFLIPPTISKENSLVIFTLRRILKLIGNYHLGVFIYMGMTLMVVLLCRLFEHIYCKANKITIIKESRRFNIRRAVIGMAYVSFIIFITLFGVHKAGDIKKNSYDINISKGGGHFDDLKVVMVADLHLGYNIGTPQIRKMVSLINEEDADLVIIAGDIFDNEFDALDDPDALISLLASIRSKYGTYAVYGNHDISERIIGGFTFDWSNPNKGSSNEMDDFLRRSNIHLLMDDYVLIEDSFYIYGRPDFERPGKSVSIRKTPLEITKELDLSKPVIVIDHEPRELNELSLAGVDLDLCGHTHDGQFFPMNLTSRYFTWENSAGLLMKGNMANIVTSGVGLFGPNIRIGTQAEICPITIHFEK